MLVDLTIKNNTIKNSGKNQTTKRDAYFRSEGEVVDEHNGRGECLGAVLLVQEVAVDQFERGVDLAVEGHPTLEPPLHVLRIIEIV